MKIKKLYKCTHLVAHEDTISFNFELEGNQKRSQPITFESLVRLTFYQGQKDAPDFVLGEIYSFQFETIPDRIIKTNEEENLPPINED